ncbi:MAG: alpha/beta fold hydrolase [Anaerolineae bacterium]
MKWRRRILIGILVLVAVTIVGVIGFWSWTAISTQHPESLAQAALIVREGVSVDSIDGAGYVLTPDSPSKTGFIFYSGGLVRPEAYAAHLRPIAAAGHMVFAPQMPLNLAVFDLNAADEIIANHPEIERWVIGGHSLGGAMAAQYTLNHDDEIDGLVLWASFPAEGADLSGFDIEAISIFGSNDGLAIPEEIQESAKLLPADTIFSEIVGGNHAQFGDYGEQSGDNAATVSIDMQIDQTVEHTLAIINSIESK